MTVTVKQRNRLQRAINRYARACVEFSWRGGGDPMDVPAIEWRLKLALRHLNKVLDEIVPVPGVAA